MIELDFNGIGQRIASFRKEHGMSAEKLAEVSGAGLTRSVVANIESGRRGDIPLSQLLAIAWALGVPPAVLIFDTSRPRDTIETTGGDRSIAELLDWMSGWPARGPMNSQTTKSTAASSRRLLGIRNYDRTARMLSDLLRAKEAVTSDPSLDTATKGQRLHELNLQLEMVGDQFESARQAMLSEGVDIDGSASASNQ
ncbi:helix-turn-helix transcriptional regulator [Leifsonia sp. ZF2019]|uniref:helix-turn-helix domain-containing protein n=1 Tax=Leifsonia sp. ZF2019 TaxID=2781978 RepID=UPI001CBED85D|nr:helix-turn-helix transcriptional regulator [Leifsonia sp. ZF2019]UAJ78627.1 helix-turn-helix transcriptional regulator [Leifsonia sp. ZF2019]